MKKLNVFKYGHWFLLFLVIINSIYLFQSDPGLIDRAIALNDSLISSNIFVQFGSVIFGIAWGIWFVGFVMTKPWALRAALYFSSGALVLSALDLAFFGMLKATEDVAFIVGWIVLLRILNLEFVQKKFTQANLNASH
ncbi:hypothetical protein THMIRHAS_16650 [Thiosulfatimonas sediminis]|uniref:DUF4345 domain-containing protein n=1 Tax=Thiosulfatimonas sediminis TaxID=2675054 RepID=A0A6F8PVW6_9GAMM|nr:hypothetical protein [Thiosulfatimonas sediminis]BBP46292.1 hypothetical protein THMIRHAS_16650 [Thiosulfatimonas sediminis]